MRRREEESCDLLLEEEEVREEERKRPQIRSEICLTADKKLLPAVDLPPEAEHGAEQARRSATDAFKLFHLPLRANQIPDLLDQPQQNQRILGKLGRLEQNTQSTQRVCVCACTATVAR